MSSWAATGAGNDNYNGTYTVAGQISGVDYYGNGSRYLVFVAGTWFLSEATDPTPFTAEYMSNGATPATTDAAWQMAPGGTSPPPPTLVAGEAPPVQKIGPFPTHFNT